MKKVLILFTGLFMTVSTYGQLSTPCGVPHAMTNLHGNNILATVSNDGTLFYDGSDGRFIPDPAPNGTGPSTIFSAGLWIAGVDPGNNLKLAVADYKDASRSDYFAGPLMENGLTNSADCGNWDRQFKVTSAEIAAFLTALPGLAGNPAAAITQFPNIMGWPGRGNPYFSTINGFDLPNTNQSLAGFWDYDNDAVYNPLNGDYPAVLLRGITPFVPAMQVWSVFNDEGNGAQHRISQGKTMQIEVQLTTWAFNCLDKPILNNTVFTSHKIIYRGTERLDSTYIGIWTDLDIGCYGDDYVGSNPGIGFFVYNQDAVDGFVGSDCGPITTFGDHPPVQSVTFLSQKMDKMIAYIGSNPNLTPDPSSPVEYYYYLNGLIGDGQPTEGGNGYNPGTGAPPVDYMYPGDPADPNAWSMCSTNSLPGEAGALGSTKIGAMLPGAVEELTLAWTVHPNPPLPCGLGTMYDDVNWLRDFYTNGFSGLCSFAAKAPEPAPDTLELFPNPAMNQFTLVYGNMKISELRLYAADGRWVRTLQNLPSEKVIVPVQDLTTGMYEMQLITDQGNFIRKLSIAR